MGRDPYRRFDLANRTLACRGGVPAAFFGVERACASIAGPLLHSAIIENVRGARRSWNATALQERDVDNDFQPQYVTIKGKAQVLADIKKKALEADKIFLAPDPDREGEAIAWHIAGELAGKKGGNGRIF